MGARKALQSLPRARKQAPIFHFQVAHPKNWQRLAKSCILQTHNILISGCPLKPNKVAK
jgi:hypothetical protein